MKALTIFGLIGLLTVAGVFSSDLEAEVKPEIEYVYFTVPYIEGKSVEDVILINSPLVGKNGHKHLGITSWRIKYDKATFSRPKIDVCRIEEPNVTCSCKITLPKLEGGDESFRAKFAQRAEKTKRHELEHCRIAVTHANDLERIFRNFNNHSCKEIRKKMREAFVKVQDDCSVEQTRFDHAEYGYSQYLYLESLQQMRDSGFNIAPPAEGRSLPRLDRKKKPEMKVIRQDVEELKQEGFYKDENGVWRNY